MSNGYIKISFTDPEVDASLLEEICSSFKETFMRYDSQTQQVTFLMLQDEELTDLKDELAKATDAELQVEEVLEE